MEVRPSNQQRPITDQPIFGNGDIVTKFQPQITPEYSRNRDKWDAYQRRQRNDSAHQQQVRALVMVVANDKYFAGVKIKKALIERLEVQLEGRR